LRPKYDGAGAVVGLTGVVGLSDDVPGLGVDLESEARRKDHGDIKVPLDLRCLVFEAGAAMMGDVSETDVPEDLRNVLDKDNERRGEELEESDSTADSRHVSRV